MTPQQKQTLIASAKRIGLSASLLFGAFSWGFTKYDATNASALELRDFKRDVATRRTIDSLKADFQYRAIVQGQLRADSALRKVCAKLGAEC